jgi:predicted ATPase with chaperone activity
VCGRNASASSAPAKQCPRSFRLARVTATPGWPAPIKRHCKLSDAFHELIRVAITELNLSVRLRSHQKVFRTVDLAASDFITPEHVSEAIQYRTFQPDAVGLNRWLPCQSGS